MPKFETNQIDVMGGSVMEWEYKHSSYTLFGEDLLYPKDEHISKWNDLGREGWELVSVVREQTTTTGYFKRAKPTDAEV
jgi:hypothetical protein